MKILVCGGRDYDDYAKLKSELDLIHKDRFSQTAMDHWTIISGCAKGADTLAIRYAEEWGDPVLKFPADWDTHGRAAGPIRNQQMLDEGKPDLVVAFPGGRGTAHMIKIAKEDNIEVIQID